MKSCYPQFIYIALIFPISTKFMYFFICSVVGPQLSHRREPASHVSIQNLNLSICSSSLQPREWVRISCHRFIFYFYCSTALPLITNDGFNDLWCAKSLFTCGWKWEDGSAEESDTDECSEADVWQNPQHFNLELDFKNTICCMGVSFPVSKSICSIKIRGRATVLKWT